jgi:sugar/nucleoside kinase (ribokinase family)
MTISFVKTPEPNRTGAGLCVVGNLTIDVILRGITDLPLWGQEVLSHDRTETVAGQAGAVAFAASALGIATEVVSAVGDDTAGSRIRHELSDSGVGVDAAVVVSGGITPMTIALVRPDGERAFVSDLGTLPGINVAATAVQWMAAHTAGVVALVGTSNIPNIDQEAAVEFFRLARQRGALTVFDPGWDPLGWSPQTLVFVRAILAETDLFVPNQDEVEALTGERAPAPTFDALNELCPGTTVVKAGVLGSYAADGEEIVNVRAIPTSVDNAVGAGDVFDSGVIAGYLNGSDILASMALASAAASIYVGRRDHRFPEYGDCMELANVVEVSVVDR